MPITGKDIVLYEKEGHVVTITLNRSERLNSLTYESFNRLHECWTEFRDDDDARVAILTGAGNRAFCTGMDLKWRVETGTYARDPSAVNSGGQRLQSPVSLGVYKPIIAAVNGYATAGGLSLLMQCDLRVSANSALIGISEVKVGRGTPWAVPLIWQMPQAIGLEMLLTGEFMSAEKLHGIGWINEVVSAEQLMPTARRLAERISDNAPLSVMAAKKSWYKAIESFCQVGLEMAEEIYAPLYASEDAREGPRAFAEKRKPVWKGK